MVCVTDPDTVIASEDYSGVRKEGTRLAMPKTNLRAGLLVIGSQVQGLLRESWTKGPSGVRPVIHWAGLMGYEDMKAEDYTRVTPTMRLYLPRVEARLRDITALWFCRKKGHLHTIPCNEQGWDKELAYNRHFTQVLK